MTEFTYRRLSLFARYSGGNAFLAGMGRFAIQRVMLTGLFVLLLCACLSVLNVCLQGRRFRGAGTVRLFLSLGLLGAYAGGLYSLTLGGRVAGTESKAKLELLWSYRESLVLFGESPSVSNESLFTEIVLNMMLFAPLGALLAFAWPKRFRGMRGVGLVAVAGACVSLAIELSQWVFRLGLFELDDVLNNMLGAVGGYLVFSAMSTLLMQLRHRDDCL